MIPQLGRPLTQDELNEIRDKYVAKWDSATKDQQVQWVIESEELLRQNKILTYGNDFYRFNKEVLKWPDIYEPLHKKVCDFIQENIWKKKILLLLPRGTFKSSIVTVGGTSWLIGSEPQVRVLLANGTRDMAVSFLGQVKDQLRKNEKFKKIYGDLALNAETWREDKLSIGSEKSYEAKDPTVQATGIGTNVVGSHFDIAILDDPVTRENSGTKEQIEKVIQFYKDTLDLIDPLPNGHKPMIIIGTTWHEADLYAWIQDRDTGISDEFAVMKLPAYEGEWEKGELLFPTRLTWDALKSLKKNQGPSHFSAQYLLDPVPLENATFKQKFKYYEESDIEGLFLNKFISVDPALSESKEADFSAMICVGVDHDNTWYILDIWRDKVNPQRLLDQIFKWHKKWQPITVAIESGSFQKTLRFYAGEEMKKRNYNLYITELVHNDRSKRERILGLEPRYENGDIIHNKYVPFIKDLEEELRRFPRSKHDDISDALASILEVAYPPKKKTKKDEWGEQGSRRVSKYPA